MNFRDLPKVQKLWGAEYWLKNDQNYCMKVLEFNFGYKASLHYHEFKHETFFVTDGAFNLETVVEGEHKLERLMPGSFVDLSPNTWHRLWALSPKGIIVEASTFHDDSDVIRLEESRRL